MDNDNIVYTGIKSRINRESRIKDKNFISSSLYNSFKKKEKSNGGKKEKKSFFGFFSMNDVSDILVLPKKINKKAGREKCEMLKIQKSKKTYIPKPLRETNRFVFNNTKGVRRYFSTLMSFIQKKLHSERTILIFADDTDKAFSIPISNLTIGFTVALFSVLVAFGFVSYNKSKNERASLAEVSKSSRAVNEQNKSYAQALHTLSEKLDEYSEIVFGFSKVLAYTSYTPSKNSDREINASANNIKNIFSDIDVSLRDLEAFYTSVRKYASMIPAGWPVANGGRITSGFGIRYSPFTMKSSFHAGIDIAGPEGTPILAVADGKVLFSGWRDGYGNFVMLEHDNGYQTAYGHNYQNKVVSGQTVKKGQIIALMGKTGRVTGTHCHFEVRIDNKVVNPSVYLNAKF